MAYNVKSVPWECWWWCNETHGSFCSSWRLRDVHNHAESIQLGPGTKERNVLFRKEGKEMFYLRTHSTHFIYGYMASDIWLRTILIVRKETRCCHIGYSFQLAARVLLYASSHRQDNTYHSLCYTSRGALAGTRNSSMGPPHEGSIRRPIAPWVNALTTELHLALYFMKCNIFYLRLYGVGHIFILH